MIVDFGLLMGRARESPSVTSKINSRQSSIGNPSDSATFDSLAGALGGVFVADAVRGGIFADGEFREAWRLRCGGRSGGSRAVCSAAIPAGLADGKQMHRSDESLVEKAQDGVGEAGGMAVTVFPVGERFLTALEQGGELFLGEFEALAHGLDVRTRHQAEVARLDSFDLLTGFRRKDFLTETPVHLDLDGLDEARRLVLGGGKMDVEAGGIGLGVHGFIFKKARMA